MSKNKLHGLTEKLDQFKQKVVSQSKILIKDAADEFFTANPTVVAVRWNQYIPGFNDGEPCLFTFGNQFVKTTTELTEEEQDELVDSVSDDGEGFINLEECQDWETKKYVNGLNSKIVQSAEEFFGAVASLDTILGEIFDTNAEITIARGSDEFEVTEYDCGY